MAKAHSELGGVGFGGTRRVEKVRETVKVVDPVVEVVGVLPLRQLRSPG